MEGRTPIPCRARDPGVPEQQAERDADRVDLRPLTEVGDERENLASRQPRRG